MDDDEILSDWVIALKERQERFALSLIDVAYGPGTGNLAVVEKNEDLLANYRADAWDIMLANPHLLDLEMRTNLAHLGLIKEED